MRRLILTVLLFTQSLFVTGFLTGCGGSSSAGMGGFNPNPNDGDNDPPAPRTIFATRVVDVSPQGEGGGIYNPANALGAPQGGGYFLGSLHVHTLGVGGFITLGFEAVMVNGPGADFIVSENPFLCNPDLEGFCSELPPGESYAEAVFVEVSSDGENFARFPVAVIAPTTPGSFTRIGSWEGLAGAMPVFAGNPDFSEADPRDGVAAGGDAFDLEELLNHPLVRNGSVDLNAITQIRLIDVIEGVDADDTGKIIQDNGGPADIDAVTILQHRANQTRHAPSTLISNDPSGHLKVTITDPDDDLDYASLKVSLSGYPLDAPFAVFRIASQLPGEFVGTLDHLLWSRDAAVRLAVSMRDAQGVLSSAQKSGRRAP